ncbi:olfactory receptor 51T1-like [Crassostrea angulata]|uniref:olfactory receptor 51T1-like n=1 Tax=Magallana angulata TaxID=2784310 RepID=UPI0022B1D8DF|nr:olfactory receptor 51T1-like [Crassostrea angulata]
MANTYVVIAASVLFCIGLIGNSITVCFVAVSKRLHTPTYVLIGCLAVSDVLVSVTRYVQIFEKSFFKEYTQIYIYWTFSFLFLHSAFFHMVLVSYVRFVFITNPLRSLILTCKKILWMSFAIWISSIVVSIGYGTFKVLKIMNIKSFKSADFAEVGFGLYICGLPFIIVVFNVRKLYYLYNQTASVLWARIANSMSLLFCIIIVIYLLSTIYPLIYTINYALLNSSFLDSSLDLVHDMFSFSLLVNTYVNPLIYFMFSPPI